MIGSYALDSLSRRWKMIGVAVIALIATTQLYQSFLRNPEAGIAAAVPSDAATLTGLCRTQATFLSNELQPGDRLLLSSPKMFPIAGFYGVPHTDVEVVWVAEAELAEIDDLHSYLRENDFDAAAMRTNFIDFSTSGLVARAYDRSGKFWGNDNFTFLRLPRAGESAAGYVTTRIEQRSSSSGAKRYIISYKQLSGGSLEVIFTNPTTFSHIVEVAAPGTSQSFPLSARSYTRRSLEDMPTDGKLTVTVRSEPGSRTEAPDVVIAIMNLVPRLAGPEDWASGFATAEALASND